MTSLHRKLLLTGFVISPIVVLALLINWIAVSLQNPAIHKQPPVGAGAGQTGGANALGEAIKARSDAVPHLQPAIHVPAGAGPAAADEMINPIDLPQGFMIVVSDKSGKSSASSPIYMAGSMNGWNPRDDRFKLTAQSDMKWRLLITPELLGAKPSTLEFKFTRGSWDLEETNADFSIPGNKLLQKIKASAVKPGEPPMIEYTVVSWVDSNPNAAQRHVGDDYRSVQAEGTLKRVQVRGGAGSAEGRMRDVLVWLPAGYDAPENAAKTYPVLYLHDGQNVFEKLGSVPGEWKADETATQLIAARAIAPVIIVGIPHSGSGRASEYLPVNAIEGVAPEADKHVAWLMSEVLPRIERSFRVSTNPKDTVIGGASLGAVVSMEAYARHPQRFGGLLLESLPLTSGNASAWTPWLERQKTWPAKVFIGMGGREFGTDQAARNDALVAAVKGLDQRIAASSSSSTSRLLLDADAEHNENAWAKRFPEALKFFFPGSDTGK